MCSFAPLSESHEHKEVVTILPNTNTTIHRLPGGFKINGTDNRERSQKRRRTNQTNKVLQGGGKKAKGTREAKPAPVRLLSKHRTEASSSTTEEPHVKKGRVAMYELMHHGAQHPGIGRHGSVLAVSKVFFSTRSHRVPYL